MGLKNASIPQCWHGRVWLLHVTYSTFIKRLPHCFPNEIGHFTFFSVMHENSSFSVSSLALVILCYSDYGCVCLCDCVLQRAVWYMHSLVTQQIKDGCYVLVLRLGDKHTINKTMFLKPVSSKSTESKKITTTPPQSSRCVFLSLSPLELSIFSSSSLVLLWGLGWNSLCRSRWPWTQNSACLCLWVLVSKHM